MTDFVVLLSDILGFLSYLIGAIGVVIILLGVLQTIWLYCLRHSTMYFGKLRLILNTHMILGLDFFIGKDIIDTFLLNSVTTPWQDLVKSLGALVIIISIRIVLTHFLEKEIVDIKHEAKRKLLDI